MAQLIDTTIDGKLIINYDGKKYDVTVLLDQLAQKAGIEISKDSE